MIDIDWDPPQPKGSRRYRKASTIHGWVTKMRGTLLDDERVRQRGIREMRDARAIQKYRKEHPELVAKGGRSFNFLAWFSFVPARKSSSREIVVRRHTSQRRPNGGDRSHSSRSSRSQQYDQGARLQRQPSSRPGPSRQPTYRPAPSRQQSQVNRSAPKEHRRDGSSRSRRPSTRH